jgi:hypothetical protein
MKRQKIARDFTNWLASQYLKGDTSKLLTHESVPSRTGHSTMILDHRWVLWGPLRALQSHEKTKNRNRFHKLASSQYLKGDADELLTQGSVPCRIGHGAIIFSHRWVIWEPLGVLQSHEKAKNRNRFHKLAVKSISQGISKRAIDTRVCPEQHGT